MFPLEMLSLSVNCTISHKWIQRILKPRNVSQQKFSEYLRRSGSILSSTDTKNEVLAEDFSRSKADKSDKLYVRMKTQRYSDFAGSEKRSVECIREQPPRNRPRCIRAPYSKNSIQIRPLTRWIVNTLR